MEFTAEELSVFESIERRREEIIAEARPLTYRDYGAGNPEENRSDDQMYEGVAVESSTDKNCRIGLKGEWARWMYAAVKKHSPKTILEMGTNCGFSSIYMSKGAPEASIHTIEGAEAIACIAQENSRYLGCSNIHHHIGRFQDILESVASSIAPIDFVFIDGHHDGDATVRYFTLLKPYFSGTAVIVFDDIHWSEGMEKGWNTIIAGLDETAYEDLGKLGIVYRQS